MHDQYPTGGEFVSPEELGRVMDLGASWLMEHGGYEAQEGLVVDEHNGLPVVVAREGLAKDLLPNLIHFFQQPYYEAVIPKRILDVVAPGVSETFELSDNLKLSYFVPCYQRTGEDELEFCTAALMVEVPKPDGGEIIEDTLIIALEEDERVSSGRIPTMREGGMNEIYSLLIDHQKAESTGEVSERMQEHIHAQSFAEQTGLAHITLDELDAIEKVFLGLKIHSKSFSS
jgi:hypothetical protein